MLPRPMRRRAGWICCPARDIDREGWLRCRALGDKGDEPPCPGAGGRLEAVLPRQVGAGVWGFIPKTFPPPKGTRVGH